MQESYLKKWMDIFVENIPYIRKHTFYLAGALYSFVTVLLSFISWEEWGISTLFQKVAIILAIFLIAFFGGTIYIMFCKRGNRIWYRGKASIEVCYGNLIKDIVQKKGKHRIVVIPVNTKFDMQVDCSPDCEKPEVSPNTLHGKWILAMQEKNISSDTLKNCVKEQLNGEEGNFGTIVSLGYEKLKATDNQSSHADLDEKLTFFLLALSCFEENNIAHSDVDLFHQCLYSLVDKYNSCGQGYDLYLPVMGSGLSRLNISHKEALKHILAVLQLCDKKITGRIVVVIYPEDRDKVTIFDR